MIIRYFIILLLVSLAAGCAQSTKKVDTTDLSQIKNLTVKSAGDDKDFDTAHIREKALQKEAQRLGSRGALAAEAKIINHNLLSHKKRLKQAFNFRALMLKHNVLPPVLESADQYAHLNDSRTLHIADKTYKIVKQARFVTNPPTWRDYLIMNYTAPEMPNKALLPKNNQEQKLWQKTIERAWHRGLNQARNIYADNLSRLKRDYKGMLLYRNLHAKNMVSKPYVAKANQGITSQDNNSQINIGDKILRITKLPELNPRSEEWKSITTQ